MAHAQYETRTKTVEETVVVLRLTEDEADTLRSILDGYSGPNSVSIRSALAKPTAPMEAATSGDTFEYAGVTYDLGAAYRDQEDDCWTFTGRCSPGGSPYVTMYAGSDNRFDTLSRIVHAYGPLTKVTS